MNFKDIKQCLSEECNFEDQKKAALEALEKMITRRLRSIETLSRQGCSLAVQVAKFINDKLAPEEGVKTTESVRLHSAYPILRERLSTHTDRPHVLLTTTMLEDRNESENPLDSLELFEVATVAEDNLHLQTEQDGVGKASLPHLYSIRELLLAESNS